MNSDPLPPLLFRNPATTNWQQFTDILDTKLRDFPEITSPQNARELDILADSIQNILVEAYETACPIRKHKAGKSVPYYTSEDRNQRKRVRKAFNKCRYTRNWSTYYNELRIYSKNLRIRERTGWRDQRSAINGVHDSAKMFKILSKDPTQSVGSLLLPSGDYTKDQRETYIYIY